MSPEKISQAEAIYEAYGRGIQVKEGQTLPILSLKETMVVLALIQEARAALDLLVNHPENANLEGGGQEIFNETIRDLGGCVHWINNKPGVQRQVIKRMRPSE